jgi:hypothetical protein
MQKALDAIFLHPGVKHQVLTILAHLLPAVSGGMQDWK